MIKATGAMFSLEASGTLKNTLIFSQRGKFCYVRHKKNLSVQRDVPTDDRLRQRRKFQILKNQWLGLDPDTKNWYKRQAVGLPMTGYNFFIKFNLLTPIDPEGLPYVLPFHFGNY